MRRIGLDNYPNNKLGLEQLKALFGLELASVFWDLIIVIIDHLEEGNINKRPFGLLN